MSATGLTSAELFDPEFLQSLQGLRILSRRVARSGRPAEQRSRDMGSGIEFRDFRPYSPGDDLKAVDWNIYRRLGRVFLRLFEELEDLPVYIVVDRSASQFHGENPRIRAGLRTALAFTSIALSQHDSVGLYGFADDIAVLRRPRAGRGRLLAFADSLVGIEPGGATDFRAAMRRFSAMGLREGLVVVLSDFFDPGGAEAVSQAFKTLRHRLLMVQLRQASDRNPVVEGDVAVADCETGATENVSVTPHVLESYRASYDRFNEALTDFARRAGAGFLALDVEEPVVPQLATLFETGSYTP